MISIAFGKRQRLAHKTSETLAQSIVPALNMSGFTALFTDRAMLVRKRSENGLIGIPKVTECMAMTILCRNPMPKSPTTFFTTVADEVGNYLASLATQSNPNPAFI